MSYPPPNFNNLPNNPGQVPNQLYFIQPAEHYQYMQPPQINNYFAWNIHPSGLPQIQQNVPKIVEKDMDGPGQQQNDALNIDSSSETNRSDATSNNNKPKERTKPSVIPTTKFINETFDFNRKKRNRRKNKAEKLPDPQLTETVKEVLKQFELNQKSLAVDVGSSETMVSQWINGTSKATGWTDFEAKIRLWLEQEHKKPEKGPAFDFIDESTKLKSKFLRKSKK